MKLAILSADNEEATEKGRQREGDREADRQLDRQRLQKFKLKFVFAVRYLQKR